MASSGSSVPHTRILLGLVLGAVIGSGINYFTAPPPVTPDPNRDALAAVVGNAPSPPPAPPERAAWVGWIVRNITKPVGDIFLNLLFMAIIPLVFASLTVGVTRLGGSGNVGRVGVKTFAYFLVTTACAATIGLSAVNFIEPGKQVPAGQRDELMHYYGKEAGEKLDKKADFGIETIVNIVPKNPLKSLVEKDMLAVIFSAILV